MRGTQPGGRQRSVALASEDVLHGDGLALAPLDLGDGAEPHTDTNQWKSQKVPFQTGRRVFDAAAVVEPGLEEQAAGADRFRIFSDERPLLRERQDRLQYERSQTYEDVSHQNCRLLSTSTVRRRSS